MDQAKLLRAEAASPHAAFHQFVLAQSRCASNAVFLFFEGEDDACFYVGHIVPRLAGREYHEFVCDGRSGVLKLVDLCAQDGRAIERTLFFVDKDLTDIFPADPSGLTPRTFQTHCYSFENYIVCESVLRRYWVERLRLTSLDVRYADTLERYRTIYRSFSKRMLILMAIVLIGRGIDGNAEAKLNLRNVNLEKVLRLDLESARVTWRPSAGSNFLAASNIKSSGVVIRSSEMRRVVREHLRHRAEKSYLRGKFELWFFARFLATLSNELSDRQKAAASGLPRATPREPISVANCLETLAPLAPTPPELHAFLEAHI